MAYSKLNSKPQNQAPVIAISVPNLNIKENIFSTLKRLHRTLDDLETFYKEESVSFYISCEELQHHDAQEVRYLLDIESGFIKTTQNNSTNI